ncbi:MAG: SHOCT domain-containing protein [Actinomycetales bacterium]|nr:SHOCT domain-containing protein [Actinomycetales bacterium]
MTDLADVGASVWTWALWGLVVVGAGLLVYVVVRLLARASRRRFSAPSARPPGTEPSPVSDPREILEQRLARGEIDVEEFAARLQALEGR